MSDVAPSTLSRIADLRRWGYCIHAVCDLCGRFADADLGKFPDGWTFDLLIHGGICRQCGGALRVSLVTPIARRKSSAPSAHPPAR